MSSTVEVQLVSDLSSIHSGVVLMVLKLAQMTSIHFSLRICPRFRVARQKYSRPLKSVKLLTSCALLLDVVLVSCEEQSLEVPVFHLLANIQGVNVDELNETLFG